MLRRLFDLNPALDLDDLARRFAADRRLQVRDILTEETARTVQRILAEQTDWTTAWQAGADGPHIERGGQGGATMTGVSPQIAARVGAAMNGRDYGFAYASYPMLQAYLEKWNEGSPQDLLLEYINAPDFLAAIRRITGIPTLVKADAQATLYAPGHFLAVHDDSQAAEGRRVAYVLNFCAEDWRPDWGAYLNFFNEDGDIEFGFRPRFNALNLFAVPQRHHVSYTPPFAPVARYAITGWFRDF